MSMVRALRTLAAMENGTLNAAALETLLSGSQARKDEVRQLLSTRSLFDRIAASKNACDALTGSASVVAILGSTMPYQTELVAALLKQAPGKMMLHGIDALLNTLKGSASLMAAARAASGYSAIGGVTANGTTPVSLAPYITGSAYILLGVSHASTTIYSYTLSTLRSGSSISAAVSTNTTSNTQAKDHDIAVPITSPYSFTSQTGNTSLSYFGVLRCDV